MIGLFRQLNQRAVGERIATDGVSVLLPLTALVEPSRAELHERIGATMQVLVDSAPALGRKGGDSGERHIQILLDIITERFERGNVDHLGLVVDDKDFHGGSR